MFDKNLLLHTYVFIKIHEIGNHFDIRMVDPSLVDNFLKNVPNPSRKDEHRNIMFTELIKEVLVSFSATQNVSTNQTSNKSQEKSKFSEDSHINFGRENYFSLRISQYFFHFTFSG